MKILRFFLFIILVCSVKAFAETPSYIKSLKPSGFYNNFSKQFPNFITKNESEILEDKLRNFSNSGFGEIGIVVIDDYSGMEENAFATEIFNHFKIGKKGKDNGVLVLIKPTETPPGRRVYISTGYGAESLVTDFKVKMIIEKIITPRFKTGEYYSGLAMGVNTLANILSENSYDLDLKNYDSKQAVTKIDSNVENPIDKSANSKSDSKLELFLFLIIILIILSEIFLPKKTTLNRNIYFGGTGIGLSHRRFGSFGGGFGGFGGGFSGGGGAGGGW